MTLILLGLLSQLVKPLAAPSVPAPEVVTPPSWQIVKLKVGEQKASPTPTAIGVNCDDRTIVEVLDLGDHLEFKGLTPGKTLCALGRGKQPPQVIEITVVGS